MQRRQLLESRSILLTIKIFMTNSPNDVLNGEDDHIQTKRLLLRRLKFSDADNLLRYQTRNRSRLKIWEPQRDESFFTQSVVEKRVLSMEMAMSEEKALHLIFFHRDDSNNQQPQIIGECNFSNIVRGAFQACHLGYSIDGEHEGQGLMQEALSASIHFLFNTYHLHRIMANYRPENSRSERVLQRLGFEKEGFARSYLHIDGQWADHVLTSLINDNY